MYTRKAQATRESPQCVIRDDQPDAAREGQAGRTGVGGRGSYTAEAGQWPGEGKGALSFKYRRKDVVRDLRLGNLATPKSVQKTADGVTRETRRLEAGIAFKPLVRQDQPRTTFWRMPMPVPLPTKARRASTARILRTSKHTGSSEWLAELALALRAGDLPAGGQSDEWLLPKANGNKLQTAGHLERAGSGHA